MQLLDSRQIVLAPFFIIKVEESHSYLAKHFAVLEPGNFNKDELHLVQKLR